MAQAVDDDKWMTWNTGICAFCGKTGELQLTVEQFHKVSAWKQGYGMIQDVLSEFSPAEREMLISGTHGPCYDQMFAEPEL
jgi:hypothetical protein